VKQNNNIMNNKNMNKMANFSFLKIAHTSFFHLILTSGPILLQRTTGGLFLVGGCF